MRILLLSYHLYPDHTSEGICVAKTARALVDHGHEVEIVTSRVNRLTGEVIVPNTGLLKGIRVHRVAARPESLPKSIRYSYNFAKHRRERGEGRVWEKLEAAINIMLGCTPDQYAWVKSAAKVALQLWRNRDNHSLTVLYSRLNHFLSHLAALHLVRQAPEISWCAHFSDPWPHHLYPGDYRSHLGPISQRRLEALLDEILKRANSLTFPAERLMRFLLAGLRQKYQQKAHIVPHLGNFWLEVPTHAKNGKFTLLFTGLILRQRVSEAFFQALCRFLNREPSAREAISVQFVGRETSLLKEAVRKYDLVEMVRITPHKPLEEVWPLICQSDVLLLIESPMREGVFMPSKLADYLSSGRPILALSPAIGTVADFLSKGGGIRVDPDNPDQIARALADLYRRWRANRLDELKPPASLINQVAPAHVVPAYETAFQQAAAIA